MRWFTRDNRTHQEYVADLLASEQKDLCHYATSVAHHAALLRSPFYIGSRFDSEDRIRRDQNTMKGLNLGVACYKTALHGDIALPIIGPAHLVRLPLRQQLPVAGCAR